MDAVTGWALIDLVVGSLLGNRDPDRLPGAFGAALGGGLRGGLLGGGFLALLGVDEDRRWLGALVGAVASLWRIGQRPPAGNGING